MTDVLRYRGRTGRGIADRAEDRMELGRLIRRRVQRAHGRGRASSLGHVVKRLQER
jgi:hypothetical protein